MLLVLSSRCSHIYGAHVDNFKDISRHALFLSLHQGILAKTTMKFTYWLHAMLLLSWGLLVHGWLICPLVHDNHLVQRRRFDIQPVSSSLGDVSADDTRRDGIK